MLGYMAAPEGDHGQTAELRQESGIVARYAASSCDVVYMYAV